MPRVLPPPPPPPPPPGDNPRGANEGRRVRLKRPLTRCGGGRPKQPLGSPHASALKTPSGPRTRGRGRVRDTPLPDPAGGPALVALLKVEDGGDGLCLGKVGHNSGKACVSDDPGSCPPAHKNKKIPDAIQAAIRVGEGPAFFVRAVDNGRTRAPCIMYTQRIEGKFVSRELETTFAPPQHWAVLVNAITNAATDEDRHVLVRTFVEEWDDLEEKPTGSPVKRAKTADISDTVQRALEVDEQINAAKDTAAQSLLDQAMMRARMLELKEAVEAAESKTQEALEASSRAEGIADDARVRAVQADSLAGEVSAGLNDTNRSFNQWITHLSSQITEMGKKIAGLVTPRGFQRQQGLPPPPPVPGPPPRVQQQTSAAAQHSTGFNLRFAQLESKVATLVVDQGGGALTFAGGLKCGSLKEAHDFVFKYLPHDFEAIIILQGWFETVDVTDEEERITHAQMAKHMANSKKLNQSTALQRKGVSYQHSVPLSLASKAATSECDFNLVPTYDDWNDPGSEFSVLAVIDEKRNLASETMEAHVATLQLHEVAESARTSINAIVASFHTYITTGITTLFHAILAQMGSDAYPTEEVKKAAWKVVTGALVLIFRDIRKARVVAATAYTISNDPVKANALYFYAICKECVLLKKIMAKPLKEYETVRTAMVGFVLDHFVPKHKYLELKNRVATVEKDNKALAAKLNRNGIPAPPGVLGSDRCSPDAPAGHEVVPTDGDSRTVRDTSRKARGVSSKGGGIADDASPPGPRRDTGREARGVDGVVGAIPGDAGLWTGRRAPVEAAHAATGLVRGFLPTRGTRGRVEVRGFEVVVTRFQDDDFARLLARLGLKARNLTGGRHQDFRRGKEVDVVCLDSSSLPPLDSGLYWSRWTIPHVFFADVGARAVAPPAGWSRRARSFDHASLGGSTSAAWELVAWYPPGADAFEPCSLDPQPFIPLQSRLKDRLRARACRAPAEIELPRPEVCPSPDGLAVMGWGLLPHDDLRREVVVPCQASASGFGRRAVSPLELADLWDISILVTDEIS
ncbi:hypothetical protein THAOC_13266, partial [Thalassiosira oceanica]